MTDPYGLEAVLASLSAKQAKGMGLLTSGTSGPHGSMLLRAASDLMCLSLGNKLRAKQDETGLILYRVTWKHWITPAGRLILAQRASGHPIHVKEFSGLLPTPTAMEFLDKSYPATLAKIDKGGRLARWICKRSSTARSHQEHVFLNPSFALWMMVGDYHTCRNKCAQRVTRSTSPRRKRSLKR